MRLATSPWVGNVAVIEDDVVEDDAGDAGIINIIIISKIISKQIGVKLTCFFQEFGYFQVVCNDERSIFIKYINLKQQKYS